MSFVKLGSDNFENFTLVAHPKRTFSSSSIPAGTGSISGSVPLFARRSKFEKEPRPLGAFAKSMFSDADLESARAAVIEASKGASVAYSTVIFSGAPSDGEKLGMTGSTGQKYDFEFDSNGTFDDLSTGVDISGAGSSPTNLAAAFTASIETKAFGDFRAERYGGTVHVYQLESGSEGNTPVVDDSVSNVTAADFTGGSGANDFYEPINSFLELVNSQSISAKKEKELNIIRFEPSFKFTSDTQRKNVVQNVLMPYHRAHCSGMHFAYTNYHSLNFFTASLVPSASALIYPNQFPGTGYGPYTPSGSFTFDFYINPNQTTRSDWEEFHAGTIMHLSSTFAVSLVTGSSRGPNGLPNGYRIMLQLSHSVDTPPSKINLSTLDTGGYNRPKDLIYISNNNSLKRNNWHHVAIRWGTQTQNLGTGSFYIDGVNRGDFNIPSSSIAPVNVDAADFLDDPDVFFIGNYWDGPNNDHNSLSNFFNTNVVEIEGLSSIGAGEYDPTGSNGKITDYCMTHPLRAEVHDLKIFDHYRTLEQILTSSMQGVDDLKGLLFYLPPFFTRETRTREVPISPFQTHTSTTDDPFNVSYSFGVFGHLINAENFLREFVQAEHPRLYHMTASVITETIHDGPDANTYLFSTGSIRKRNLFLLPCDNGKFIPNFNLLISGTHRTKPYSTDLMSKYVNDYGILDLSLITLNDLVPTASLFSGLIQEEGPIADAVMGPSPDNPGVPQGSVLTIFQRTRDNTSNEVVFFDISNMYYGKRIKPHSFKIKDISLTGSDGYVPMTFKDDGCGTLYRADCDSAQASWNNIGNIFYDEGIIMIKTPNVPLFGKDQFEVEFKGEQDIHVLTINTPCPAGMINSSSNPVYMPVSATLDANDTDGKFVYITGINFHDDNLNVIGRTVLAQPIAKRDSDKFLIKSKIDF